MILFFAGAWLTVSVGVVTFCAANGASAAAAIWAVNCFIAGMFFGAEILWRRLS